MFSHGPGLWRQNLDLVEDENFCEMISNLIENHVANWKAFPTIHEWWDFLKESIKLAAQTFHQDKNRSLKREKVYIVLLTNGESPKKSFNHIIVFGQRAFHLN